MKVNNSNLKATEEIRSKNVEVLRNNENIVTENKLKEKYDRVKVEKKSERVSEEKLIEMLKNLNEHPDIQDKGIKFEREEGVKDFVVKVYEKESGKVIAQIPSEEMIQISKGVDEFMGLFFNEVF